MDPLKDYKRTQIPFGKPFPVSKDSNEVLEDAFGYVRAVIEAGVIIIQTKKLKRDSREVARIDTNVRPPTIEFAIEEARR